MADAGKLTVVGAGLMGAGIAQVSAAAGWQVTVRDVAPAALDRARQAIESSLARFVDKEAMSSDDCDATLARITTTTDVDRAVAEADVVVEAVFEDVDLKREVFRTLDRLCRDDAVLATNTSAIYPPEILSRMVDAGDLGRKSGRGFFAYE